MIASAVRFHLGTSLVAFAIWAAPGQPSLAAAAHPGHGSKVIMGTLKEVTRDAIVVEVLDVGGGGMSRVRVLLQERTRYRVDKEPLPSLDGMIGQRAVVAVDWEDDDRGGQTLRATQVRFRRPK